MVGMCSHALYLDPGTWVYRQMFVVCNSKVFVASIILPLGYCIIDIAAAVVDITIFVSARNEQEGSVAQMDAIRGT